MSIETSDVSLPGLRAARGASRAQSYKRIYDFNCIMLDIDEIYYISSIYDSKGWVYPMNSMN